MKRNIHAQTYFNSVVCVNTMVDLHINTVDSFYILIYLLLNFPVRKTQLWFQCQTWRDDEFELNKIFHSEWQWKSFSKLQCLSGLKYKRVSSVLFFVIQHNMTVNDVKLAKFIFPSIITEEREKCFFVVNSLIQRHDVKTKFGSHAVLVSFNCCFCCCCSLERCNYRQQSLNSLVI